MQGNFLSFRYCGTGKASVALIFWNFLWTVSRVALRENEFLPRTPYFQIAETFTRKFDQTAFTSLRLRINIIWIFNARILLQHLNTFTYVKNFPRLPYQNFLKPFTILWLETDWRFSIFLFAHQRHVIHEYTTDFFLLVLFYFRFWKNR